MFKNGERILKYIHSKDGIYSVAELDDVCMGEFDSSATVYNKSHRRMLISKGFDSVLKYGLCFDIITIDDMLGKLHTLLCYVKDITIFVQLCDKYINHLHNMLIMYKTEPKYMTQISIYICVYIVNKYPNYKYIKTLIELSLSSNILYDIIGLLIYGNDLKKMYTELELEINEIFVNSETVHIVNMIGTDRGYDIEIESSKYNLIYIYGYLREYSDKCEDSNNVIKKVMKMSVVNPIIISGKNYVMSNKLLFPITSQIILLENENEELTENVFMDAMAEFCENN